MGEGFKATPSCPWPLLTKEQIQNSPSRKDGVDLKREQNQTKTIVNLIKQTGDASLGSCQRCSISQSRLIYAIVFVSTMLIY